MNQVLYACYIDSSLDEFGQLISTLNANGFNNRLDVSRRRSRDLTYSLRFTRHYEPDDWSQAELLDPCYSPDSCVEEFRSHVDGKIVVGGLDMAANMDIYVPDYGHMLIPNRTKKIFENSILVGMSFERVRVVEDGGHTQDPFEEVEPPSHLETEAPFWVVLPEVTMPPLSSSMDLTDSNGMSQAPGDPKAYYNMKEGMYTHPEMHFRRHEVETMPLFDVAKTIERFGQSPKTVVSPRFYRFCIDQGIEGHWAPVRLDED
ncbi:MAG: hypothetical protein AAGC72_02635 [Planctomycetota bacterium]